KIPENLKNRYVVRHFATLDCGRGCPFQCSFCTVINVQGRRMRFRTPEAIAGLVRENYRRSLISFYFFTDDNFSRHKYWREIFETLIRLKRQEKIPLRFMMQVDTLSHRIPGFVQMASEAGCTQVFIGVESLNASNLEAADKKQNKVGDYKQMIDLYHDSGITTHLAYIIGFPFDTEASVAQDISRMQSDLIAKQASFFMLTPLPGSEDHRRALEQGRVIDADTNNFDTFHVTFRHEQMQSRAWSRAYQSAWKSFYSVENMIRILKHTSREQYWKVLMNFFWYKNAVDIEGGHPMLNGLWRLKSRKERRACFAREGRFQYMKRRVSDALKVLKGVRRLLLEMEEVWLATRPRSWVEERWLKAIRRILRSDPASHDLILTASFEIALFSKFLGSMLSGLAVQAARRA
ncbi:radical SAM protein, partial [Omnitrophica bacterium]|nr:radical SAM protein [Candidatus Omnitrophota bacterium]